MGKIDSLDYGSRTKRKRFYFFASCYDEEFSFPEPTGRLETPISSDGVMTVDSIDWITPEDSLTLKHFVDRQKGKMSHNHKITSFNIEEDSYIGTIPKSHHKYIPENILKHPYEEGKYAFIRKIDHLKYIHGIDEEVKLGNSLTSQIEAIGQGVCCKTVYAIAKQAYDFLKRNIFKERSSKEVIINNSGTDNLQDTSFNQLAFNI